MNNLDPEVAENPDELVVYGGRGKAARNEQCYHSIVDCLTNLEDDETLLVNPAWIDLEALKTFRLLKIPYDEPFGANVLRMPDCILANDLYPLTITLIEKQGYSVIGIQITEFSKAEAGLTCLSLIID